MARFLLAHGADPAFRSKQGETPADAAVKRGLDAAAALLRASYAGPPPRTRMR
jgi:ankyrin repeat protein